MRTRNQTRQPGHVSQTLADGRECLTLLEGSNVFKIVFTLFTKYIVLLLHGDMV